VLLPLVVIRETRAGTHSRSRALSSTFFAAAFRKSLGVVLLDQGPNWTPIARSRFYSQDQGSDIMPLRWMQALKQPNGQPFLADSLGRYGYLPNPAVPGFPVGFSVANRSNETVVGMTCAACHTRQITVNNVAYRADGGPAIADFQSFLADLDAAVNSVLSNETPPFLCIATKSLPLALCVAANQIPPMKAWVDASLSRSYS
jgi:hypothetical protein